MYVEHDIDASEADTAVVDFIVRDPMLEGDYSFSASLVFLSLLSAQRTFMRPAELFALLHIQAGHMSPRRLPAAATRKLLNHTSMIDQKPLSKVL